MPRERLVLIYDALQASRLIQTFLKDKPYEAYDNDVLLQSAVERQFEIIGEALNVARSIDPYLDESITNLAGIVKNRNFLAHGYFAVINAKLGQSRRSIFPF